MAFNCAHVVFQTGSLLLWLRSALLLLKDYAILCCDGVHACVSGSHMYCRMNTCRLDVVVDAICAGFITPFSALIYLVKRLSVCVGVCVCLHIHVRVCVYNHSVAASAGASDR